LPVGGRRKPPSRKLLGLLTREGGDARKEVAEDIQDNEKSVPFQSHNSRHVFRGCAPRQDGGTAAASDISGRSGRCRENGNQGPCGFIPT
jgi:hypothetical protein